MIVKERRISHVDNDDMIGVYDNIDAVVITLDKEEHMNSLGVVAYPSTSMDNEYYTLDEMIHEDDRFEGTIVKIDSKVTNFVTRDLHDFYEEYARLSFDDEYTISLVKYENINDNNKSLKIVFNACI